MLEIVLMAWLSASDLGPEYANKCIAIDHNSPTGIRPMEPPRIATIEDKAICGFLSTGSHPQTPQVEEVAPLVFKTEDKFGYSYCFGVPDSKWYELREVWSGRYFKANAERIHYDLDLMKHLRRADHD